MKKLILMVALMPMLAFAYETWTDPSTGIKWTYKIQDDGTVSIGGGGSGYPAVPTSTKNGLTIPSIIDGKTVTSIGSSAFERCSGLTSVTIPSGVTSIGEAAFHSCKLMSVTIPSGVTSVGVRAFYCCSGLTSVSIPSSVTSIGESAFFGCSGLTSVTLGDGLTTIGDGMFSGCSGLTSITIPLSVTSIGSCAFKDCSKLSDVYLLSDLLTIDAIASDAFSGCYRDMIIHVPEGWKGRRCVVDGLYFERGGNGGLSAVTLSVTNIIVNYVLNSVRPEIAVPAMPDIGFVNVIAEVMGSCVAIPGTWADNYPNFVSKYGSDFTKALTMKSGKKDGAGNEMLVWQDYVAGTDPTDENDVFRASITIVDGKVTISYSPELDDARKAMRKYTIWGKTSLMDTDWTEVQDGHEAEFNFFKVSVEMR